MYLYILFDKDDKHIKVGISQDPMQRSKQLLEDIDYKKSICVYGESPDIKNAEKAIHRTFQKHNVVRKNKTAGHTEWFDTSCYEDVIDYCNKYLNLNKWEVLKSEEEFKLTKKYTEWFSNVVKHNDDIILKYEKLFETSIILELEEYFIELNKDPNFQIVGSKPYSSLTYGFIEGDGKTASEFKSYNLNLFDTAIVGGYVISLYYKPKILIPKKCQSDTFYFNNLTDLFAKNVKRVKDFDKDSVTTLVESIQKSIKLPSHKMDEILPTINMLFDQIKSSAEIPNKKTKWKVDYGIEFEDGETTTWSYETTNPKLLDPITSSKYRELWLWFYKRRSEHYRLTTYNHITTLVRGEIKCLLPVNIEDITNE